ncbi:hypothetical protein CU098_006678 [Rhizopus stolonifer]|uniref:Uncharacterized protein n=1 Tax=Rhizopus stolonifer TaxID=4846 RepID=A0A367KJ33_RHIST|nr:hypothetical protein CU098_006678 [Rhizopus stolonifer]
MSLFIDLIFFPFLADKFQAATAQFFFKLNTSELYKIENVQLEDEENQFGFEIHSDNESVVDNKSKDNYDGVFLEKKSMIEGLDETDEAILERAEYEAGLIKDQSVIDNYIKDIQKRIQRESKKPNSGKPQEYEDDNVTDDKNVLGKFIPSFLKDVKPLNTDKANDANSIFAPSGL